MSLGGLARIARHMLAAIHLPRAISDREDFPAGGYPTSATAGRWIASWQASWPTTISLWQCGSP